MSAKILLWTMLKKGNQKLNSKHGAVPHENED